MASDTYTHVSNHYTNVASEQTGSQADQVARAFGYTLEQLAAIPLEANLGLSCGNPTAVANLREVRRGSSFQTMHLPTNHTNREKPWLTWVLVLASMSFWLPNKLALPVDALE